MLAVRLIVILNFWRAGAVFLAPSYTSRWNASHDVTVGWDEMGAQQMAGVARILVYVIPSTCVFLSVGSNLIEFSSIPGKDRSFIRTVDRDFSRYCSKAPYVASRNYCKRVRSRPSDLTLKWFSMKIWPCHLSLCKVFAASVCTWSLNLSLGFCKYAHTCALLNLSFRSAPRETPYLVLGRSQI